MFRHRVPLVAIALTVAVFLTACPSGTDDITTIEPTTRPLATATPAAAATPNPTEAPPTPAPTTAPPATEVPSPTAAPTTAPTPVATSLPDLPGEPWDLHVPLAGEQIAVVGVAFDDILEVHAAPGENTPLVGTLAPTATDVVATGEGRSLPNSIWWRVTQGDVDGWVGSRFVSRFGVTLDRTAAIVASLGTTPTAETMLDLGMIVAAERSFDDPPSRVVVSVAPTVGDLGEITIDVVGVPDDAVEGERLHIFGQPLESGEGFSLKSVEATVMCRRGVTEDGLCV